MQVFQHNIFPTLLILFQIQVLPHIVQWTTYGLCFLYRQVRPKLEEGTQIEPYWTVSSIHIKPCKASSHSYFTRLIRQFSIYSKILYPNFASFLC